MCLTYQARARRRERTRTLAIRTQASALEIDASVWYSLFVPRGTPAAIVQRLRAVTLSAMNTPAVAERLKENGATVVAPARREHDYLLPFLERDIAKWATAVRAAGLAVD